jgi:hypothetical protein
VTRKLKKISAKKAANWPVPFKSADCKDHWNHKCQRDSKDMQTLIPAISVSRQVVLQKSLDHVFFSFSRVLRGLDVAAIAPHSLLGHPGTIGCGLASAASSNNAADPLPVRFVTLDSPDKPSSVACAGIPIP